MKRVTVTLPDDVVEEIDRREKNRSRFVLEAALRELEARRREEFELSLSSPHPDSGRVAEAGMREWGLGVSPGDQDLVESAGGTLVRWTPDEGWHEVEA
jgi:hypothetical protein